MSQIYRIHYSELQTSFMNHSEDYMKRCGPSTDENIKTLSPNDQKIKYTVHAFNLTPNMRLPLITTATKHPYNQYMYHPLLTTCTINTQVLSTTHSPQQSAKLFRPPLITGVSFTPYGHNSCATHRSHLHHHSEYVPTNYSYKILVMH